MSVVPRLPNVEYACDGLLPARVPSPCVSICTARVCLERDTTLELGKIWLF
jgi:hypothetical protein